MDKNVTTVKKITEDPKGWIMYCLGMGAEELAKTPVDLDALLAWQDLAFGVNMPEEFKEILEKARVELLAEFT